jgi:hypothetical protein
MKRACPITRKPKFSSSGQLRTIRSARGPGLRVMAWLGVMDERGRLALTRCAKGGAAGELVRLFPESQCGLGRS